MLSFHALGDPTRRHIMEMLAASGRLSAGDIGKRFKVSAPAISQHLKVLRAAELVNVEARAQSRIYSVNPKGLAAARDWISRMTAQWSERFDALDDLLAEHKPQSKPVSKRTRK